MTKTVCDICGKEMSTTKLAESISDLAFCCSSYGRIWDICYECRESLNKWMTIRRKAAELRTKVGILDDNFWRKFVLEHPLDDWRDKNDN